MRLKVLDLPVPNRILYPIRSISTENTAAAIDENDTGRELFR
jgi:hypothetical protein